MVKKRLYELAEERRLKSSRRDPLEEVLEEEDRELARQAKRKRLEELILERERKIQKLKREVEEEPEGEAEKTPELKVDPKIALEISKLPEEQRQRVLETYVALESARRLKGAEAMILPLLIGRVREQPETTVKDMVEYGKGILDAFKKGAETVKTLGEKEKPAAIDPVKYLEAVKDLVSAGIVEPLKRSIEEIRPQPSVFERILLDDKLYARAKDLGMFGGKAEATLPPETQIKLKEMELEQQRELKKMDQEFQLKLAEYGEMKRRTDLLKHGFERVGATIARTLREEEEKAPVKGTVQVLKCDECGADITIPPGATHVKCAQCGAEFERKAGK